MNDPQRGRAAVLGHPIAHSKSPVLHRAAYAELGLDWDYDAIDLVGDQLGPFLNGLNESWAGLSLTMPLKIEVVAHLDALTSLASELGVVNTVVFDEGGTVGHNTDVDGVVAAFRSVGVTNSATVSIVGGGATARSALAGAAALGATRAEVVLRRPDAAQPLVRLAEVLEIELEIVPWADLDSHLDADLVISTVPAAAADDVAARLRAAGHGLDAPAMSRGVLLDVAYDPWPSPLVKQWRRLGGTAVPGWEMLLHQAAGQVELMTGQPAPIQAMRAALLATL